MKRWGFVLLLMFALVACSNRQIYEGIRANRITQCRELQGAAREQCMKPYQKSYDEYRRERDSSSDDDNG